MDITRRCTAVAALVLATAATAQPRMPEPAQPDAPAPVLRYQSAFDGYRALGDDAVGNWRAVNDRVREAAEKRTHAGHSAPTPAAASAPATPSQPRHYRDEIVPLRKRISEENVLRYNGMLIGIFGLLAAAAEGKASL